MACGLGLLALVLRWIYLQQMGWSPLFAVPVAAAKIQVDLAEQLLSTSWLGDGRTSWPAPLYPHFLAGILQLGGEGYALPRFLQAGLGAVNCVLIWQLGRAVFSPQVALIAGAAAALYGPLIYFDGELLPPVLAVFFSLLMLHALLWADAGSALHRFWVPGLLLGLAALAGVHVLLLALAILGWLWRRERKGARAGAVFCAGMALVVVPVSVFFDQTWGLIPEEFSAGFGGVAHKLYLFWHGGEVLPDLDLYSAPSESGLLAALLWKRGVAFPFGVVAPLALAGLGLRLWSGERGRAENLVLLFVAGGIGGILLSEMAAGSRLPVVAVLLLFAGAAAVDVPRRLRSWSRARQGVGAAILILLGIGLNAGPGGIDKEALASQHYWLGYACEKLDMEANAIREYDRAISSGVELAEPYYALARLYGERGDYKRAIGVYRALLQRWPDRDRARLALGDCYIMAEQAAAAAAVYQGMLAAGGDRPELLGRLGEARWSSDDPQGAIAAYREMLEVRPEDGQVLYRLARMYEAEGLYREATDAYRQLLEEPDWAVEASLRLAELLIEIDRVGGLLGRERESGSRLENLPLEAQDLAAAEGLLRESLRLEPDSRPALWGLGKMLYWLGRDREALVYVERLRLLEPEDYRIYFFLSKLYGPLGRTAEAQEAFASFQKLRRQAEIQHRVETETGALIKNILGEGR